MRWIIAVAAIVGLAGQAAAQPAAPIEVMVLGTYHFGSPGLDLHNAKVDDVLKPQRQREIESLTDALAEFRPTKILVERVARTPDLVDPNFATFTAVELAKVRDERVQIGYRLAQRLGHRNVYAIDEQPAEGEPDYFPFDKVMSWSKANGAEARLQAVMSEGAAAAAWIEQLQKEGTIGHVLLEMNRPERTARDQAVYYGLLSFGGTEHQPGADLNAMWYLRNAKIFAKLMKVAAPGDRLLVVFGAAHNYWLRHFVSTVPGFRNVDPTPYLEKAARPAR